MNGMSKETLLVIITTLSEKVEGQGLLMVELTDHIKRDHTSMDDMQYTITDLRRQLESTTDMSEENYRLRTEVYDMRDKVEHYESMRSRNEEMYAQVRKLQQENHQLTWGGKTPEETATAYMVNQGASVWAEGRKIDCIKVCREVSGWGLKETKDFCEAYMARQQEEKEESGPGTKRSSQVPAGVGTNLKKSA